MTEFAAPVAIVEGLLVADALKSLELEEGNSLTRVRESVIETSSCPSRVAVDNSISDSESDETGRCQSAKAPDFVVNATFSRPTHGEVLSFSSDSQDTCPTRGVYSMRGFVYSSGGPDSIGLHISLDDGAGWTSVDTIEQKWHMPASAGRYKSSCLWTCDVPMISLSSCTEIVMRAQDSSMGTRQYFRIRAQASTKLCADGTEIPSHGEVCFEHFKRLGLEPDHGGSAPRAVPPPPTLQLPSPSSSPRFATPTRRPSWPAGLWSKSKSTTLGAFEATSPEKLIFTGVHPPSAVDPLDKSSDSILDIERALLSPTTHKRRVEFQRTRRVLSIPSRRDISPSEANEKWYTRADFRGFAEAEKERREKSGGWSSDSVLSAN